MSARMNARLALTGPLLVIGGPYSNLKATRAILAEAERGQIPPERIVCTGNVADVPRLPTRTRAGGRDCNRGRLGAPLDPFG